MRDIRPHQPTPSPFPRPSDDEPFVPVPKKPVPSTPRFTGKPVPLSKVTLPDRLPDRAAPTSRRVTSASSAPAPRAARVGHRERKVILILLAVATVTAALAGFIFLPTADIKLVLSTAPLLVEEELQLSTDPAASATAIPGTAFFREIDVEGTSPVTSTEVVGTKAKGTVELVNHAGEEQKIKEQSRLVTKDGKLFYMQKSATLPAASGTPTRTPVTVEAAEAGEAGNITPQRLDFAALDASSRSLVYAEAKQVLAGGSGETVNVVKESDLEAARQHASQAARVSVEPTIRGELPKGWTTLDESWTVELASFESPVPLGSRESTIPYKARATVRVLGYEQQSLEDKLKAALERRLDPDFMLFPGPISYAKSVGTVDWEKSEAVINARVTHTTIPRLSLETLRQKLSSRSQQEAKSYLEGLPGVRSASIKLWPFWVQSIPRIDKRLKLDLQPERQP